MIAGIIVHYYHHRCRWNVAGRPTDGRVDEAMKHINSMSFAANIFGFCVNQFQHRTAPCQMKAELQIVLIYNNFSPFRRN